MLGFPLLETFGHGLEMKKFVVFANCQSSALAKTMLENQEFSSQYQWDFILPVQNMNSSHIDEVINKARNADLFIYQPVSEAPNRPEELTSEFLLGQLKESSEAVSFPSIYFDGYFPHLQTMKGLISILNLVHDYFIVYACAIDLSEELCFSLINRDDLYPETLSLRLAEKSLQNLKEREIKECIDVAVSGFIEKNYKNYKLFNQFNHPKRIIFKHVSESILLKIGMSDYSISPLGDSHLDMIMTPIYRSTYKNLKLKFREDFETYGAKNNLILKQKEIIRKLYDFYRKSNLEELRSHVSKTKPFIPQIVESLI